jgi:hypothetical protein
MAGKQNKLILKNYGILGKKVPHDTGKETHGISKPETSNNCYSML